MTRSETLPIAVIVVAYNAADFILDCVQSLRAARGPELRIVVVDNGSSDATSEVIRAFAGGAPFVPSEDLPIEIAAPDTSLIFTERAVGETVGSGDLRGITLVRSEENGGFAAGVNIGLSMALGDGEVDDFWILNPDSVVTDGAPEAMAETIRANPGYGIVTGRAQYLERPEAIQIDGGFFNRKTGITRNANVGEPAASTPMPKGSDLDFAFGGNMIVSRAFVEEKGLMAEDYFLYYEEVDWSLRKGDFPLLTCEGGMVFHRAGASIGSPTHKGRSATPFSLYFKHRGRLRFLRRHRPQAVATAQLYTLAKVFQCLIRRDFAGASAIWRGSFDLAPPRAVAERLGGVALERATAPFQP